VVNSFSFGEQLAAAYKERSPTVGVELGDAVIRPGSPKIMAGDDET
jgi:hypothetical protein